MTATTMCTLAQVRSMLAPLGVNVRRTEDGEYRVGRGITMDEAVETAMTQTLRENGQK